MVEVIHMLHQIQNELAGGLSFRIEVVVTHGSTNGGARSGLKLGNGGVEIGDISLLLEDLDLKRLILGVEFFEFISRIVG